MKTIKINHKEHDKVAKEMGWTGKNGQYYTALGMPVDTTASSADRLAFGYCAAKQAGHITKW